MSEYIDKGKLIDYFKDAYGGGIEENTCIWYQDVIRGIDEAPAEDVQPARRGKWVWNPDGVDWGLGAWECSECACRNNNLAMSSKINPLMFSGSKYCPNCGAKMEN